jgi:hypothetical protein
MEVLVMMDSNETLTKRNSRVLQFFHETGLTDLQAYRHPGEIPPETHERSRDRQIDICGGTSLFVNALRISGYFQYNFGMISSDHRAHHYTFDARGVVSCSASTDRTAFPSSSICE